MENMYIEKRKMHVNESDVIDYQSRIDDPDKSILSAQNTQ